MIEYIQAATLVEPLPSYASEIKPRDYIKWYFGGGNAYSGHSKCIRDFSSKNFIFTENIDYGLIVFTISCSMQDTKLISCKVK